MEAQRKVILKTLEEKQVKSSKEADDYEVKVRSVNKILDQLKAGWLFCMCVVRDSSCVTKFELHFNVLINYCRKCKISKYCCYFGKH